jgi:hypothetical protein
VSVLRSKVALGRKQKLQWTWECSSTSDNQSANERRLTRPTARGAHVGLANNGTLSQAVDHEEAVARLSTVSSSRWISFPLIFLVHGVNVNTVIFGDSVCSKKAGYIPFMLWFLIGQNFHQPFLKWCGMPVHFLVLITAKCLLQ